MVCVCVEYIQEGRTEGCVWSTCRWDEQSGVHVCGLVEYMQEGRTEWCVCMEYMQEGRTAGRCSGQNPLKKGTVKCEVTSSWFLYFYLDCTPDGP